MSQAPAPHLPQEPAVAAMLGALVADAAALGLHWINMANACGSRCA